MKIYLDVSCLNRPFDDQSQVRIRLETEAVTSIFERFDEGKWRHLASEMVEIEVESTQEEERLRKVYEMLPDQEYIILLSDDVFHRAVNLEKLAFKAADATHIAAAEKGKADVLLTCDDRMVNCARRVREELDVRVDNPVNWIQEYIDAQNT